MADQQETSISGDVPQSPNSSFQEAPQGAIHQPSSQMQANTPQPTAHERIFRQDSQNDLQNTDNAEAGAGTPSAQPAPIGMDLNTASVSTFVPAQGDLPVTDTSSTQPTPSGTQNQLGEGSRLHAGAGQGQLAPTPQRTTTGDAPLQPFIGRLPGHIRQRISQYVVAPRSAPLTSIPPSNHGVGEEGRIRIAALRKLDATAVFLYHIGRPNPAANDIWPELRNPARCPVQYLPIDRSQLRPAGRPEEIEITSFLPSRPRESSSEAASTSGILSGDPLIKSPGWPPRRMPTELYELVASYLNRDDIKSMRLVCREFDQHVSQVLFKTVVVPFNAEIYGMISKQRATRDGNLDKLSWANAENDAYYVGHGLNVFKGFGKHILRFGMSFEVTEEMLQNLPEKKETESQTSFWGTYEWPYAEYKRFAAIAGLENAADETPKMKTAFSELKNVRELALSIDNGLGWLNGPDRSLRALIKRRAPEVFGSKATVPDRRTQAQDELWRHIEFCHRQKDLDPKRAFLYKMDTTGLFLDSESIGHSPEQPQVPYFEPYVLGEANEVTDRDNLSLTSPFAGTGLLFTATLEPEKNPSRDWPALAPSQLTKAQKEWLLETEWAQKAFLMSYMLAVIDNATTFHLVHTLHISRISDGYLALLDRPDFWDALPSLKKLILRAIPTWRTVHTDQAGFAKDITIDPSSGIDGFYSLLQKRICPRRIPQVIVGWAAGGERAEGLHARNQHLLPAPLLPRRFSTSLNRETIDGSLLRFPHVESLTLENCWIMPPALEQFVKQHDGLNLEHLELDSVSLIWLPEHGNGQNGQAGGAPPVLEQLVESFRALMYQAQGVKDVLARLTAFAEGSNHFSLTEDWQGRMAQLRAQMARLGPTIWQMQQQLQTALLLAFQIVNNSFEQLKTQRARVDSGIRQSFRYWSGTSAEQAKQVEIQEYQQLHQRLGAWYQETQNLMAMVPQVGNGTDGPNAQAQLRAPPRNGSWLSVLDLISPGVNLTDFGSEFSRADEGRETTLESISLRSCGYAKIFTNALNGGLFARLARDTLQQRRRSNVFAMMLNGGAWELLADILQDINEEEFAALNAAWDLTTGWEDAEEAEGPEYDDCLPGGTGRLTGVIRRRLPVDDDAMNTSF